MRLELRYWIEISFALGVAVCELLNIMLKHWIREERPARKRTSFGHYGMPSDHAQISWFMAGYLTLFLLVRGAQEGVSAFLARLRKLAKPCQFSAGILEEMLRDRLVCGIRNERLQSRFLSEPHLTLPLAVELAQAHESAAASAAELSGHEVGAPGDSTVQRVERAAERRAGARPHPSGLRTGGQHQLRQLSAEDPQSASVMQCGDESAELSRREVAAPASDEAIDEAYAMLIVRPESERRPPLMVSVVLDGKAVEMELDTGAAVSVCSDSVLRQLWPSGGPSLEPCNVTLKSYSGEQLSVCGQRGSDVHSRAPRASPSSPARRVCCPLERHHPH
ncbi:Dolichyldiphosphatase 1 [Amphibalanus amphitrite]|uniref:Dolichyldiphosphatase 1 n=1 Tax=Amphibalanus amphitrite TaxID=1232801 RepID=A0A6A4VCJ4_AMPAM|nr:Dolichyldiphosphatase 1 [Amphibalanus amphitrite]